jgi:hypothetical protein
MVKVKFDYRVPAVTLALNVRNQSVTFQPRQPLSNDFSIKIGRLLAPLALFA